MKIRKFLPKLRNTPLPAVPSTHCRQVREGTNEMMEPEEHSLPEIESSSQTEVVSASPKGHTTSTSTRRELKRISDDRKTFISHDDKVLETLLQDLLKATYEWSTRYGYDSIPPELLLRQVCAMIDAAETVFKDEY